MKRYILLVLFALTFLILGPQAAFSQAGAVADRGNAVPREALPEDLRDLEVKDVYIDSDAQHAGFIQTAIGHVVVLHEDTGQAFFAAAGDKVFKHDSIFTLADSRCRLKFTTEDVITMGDNARLGLEEYIDNRPEKKKTSIFNMLRGKAMFYAVRLFKYRTTSTSVKTPTAVVGVRGTKFGVEVRKAGDKIAAGRPIYLAAASDTGLQHLLAQFSPGGWVTIALCFTGAIDMTALADNTTQTLYENESRAAGPEGGENKQPTSPDAAQQFESATQAPEPGAAAKEEGKKAEGKPAGGAAPVSAADTGAAGTAETKLANKAEDVTSKQTDVKIETAGKVRKGYFTGMVTDRASMPYLDNIYVSSTLQDFNSTKIRADGLVLDEGFIDGNPDGGFSNTNPTLKQVAINTALVSADNLNLAVTKGPIGSNSYMEWGYWYVVDTFIINSIVHDLYHKGYWIAGEPTPDAAVSGISGMYSGTAVGTYYNPSGSSPQGIAMTGTFSCEVNMSPGYVDNFTLDVTGGTKSAHIQNASGTFNSNSFEITGGAWTLGTTGSETAAVYKSAHGSLYGPNGENIGGAWGMKENSLNGATGIFEGSKQ
uniref:FecR domain-containing protein n=1 Tax=Candidatus Desulfatibia profunda TaxID=2841695 RepID=A0A8J6TIE2_9BACT|nr:FecR domain-containing protein [Candidatus Desulfatibia profunda]